MVVVKKKTVENSLKKNIKNIGAATTVSGCVAASIYFLNENKKLKKMISELESEIANSG